MTKTSTPPLDAEQLYRAIADGDLPHGRHEYADDDRMVQLIELGFAGLEENAKENLLERLGYKSSEVKALADSLWILGREGSSNVLPFPRRGRMKISCANGDGEHDLHTPDQLGARIKRRVSRRSLWFKLAALILVAPAIALALMLFSFKLVKVSVVDDRQTSFINLPSEAPKNLFETRQLTASEKIALESTLTSNEIDGGVWNERRPHFVDQLRSAYNGPLVADAFSGNGFDRPNTNYFFFSRSLRDASRIEFGSGRGKVLIARAVKVRSMSKAEFSALIKIGVLSSSNSTIDPDWNSSVRDISVANHAPVLLWMARD